MFSSTETIVKALRILACDIKSPDGIANAAIAEAADRLEQLQNELIEVKSRNVTPAPIDPCTTCEHKDHEGQGHCYMFKTRQDPCAKWTPKLVPS